MQHQFRQHWAHKQASAQFDPANIDGIDPSERMQEQASRKGCYRGLKLTNMLSTGLPGASYDLIVNSMAVGHVEDLDAYYVEGSRLLKANGLLVAIGFHQYFLLSGISTHFERRDGGRIAIRNYIHLFRDHFRAGTVNDFTLSDIDEAIIDESWTRDETGLATPSEQTSGVHARLAEGALG